jgi:hypothetical protein
MLTEEQKLELDNLVASMQTKGASNEEIQAAVDARKSQMLSSSDMEKPQPVAETTAPAAGQTPGTELQLESGSSELQSEEEEDEPNVLQSLIARTGRGVVTAAKGLSSFKDGLIFGAMNLYDPDKSTEEKKALYDAIERGSATDMLPSTDDFETAEDWLSKYVRRTDNESITDAITNGNYAEAAEMTVGGALESVPSVLAALTGYGGIALFGASVAGNKFDEELEKNPEEAIGTLALNALGSGATEAGFELVTRGILSKAGFINKEMGAKAAKEFLNQSAGSMAKKLGLGYLGEAGSEAATELTQTINDAYGFLGTGIGELEGRADETLAKTVGNNIKNIVDAGIVGGFMGGTISTVGALGNNTPARNRAEQILTPEVQKQQMETSAKNISEYVKDLEKTEDEYERSLLEKKIVEEENNIVKTKKKVSLGLSSLKGNNLSKYAKNQDEITKAKASIESDTDAEKAKSLARQRYDELVNENNEILESSIKQKFEDITESAEKQAGDLGVEFKRFKTSKEVEDYILSKDKRKTKKSKVLAESNDGFIIQNFDGTQEIIINEEVAMDPENQAVNVASHELLHGVLYNTLKGNPDTAENLGIELGKEIAKINVEEVADSNFRKRLELYADESTAVQGEEVLALFSDAVATGDIKYNENIFTKLGDGVRRVLETVGLKKKFNTGRDVYNFIKDYNADIAKGGLRQSIIQGAKEGFEGKLVKDAEKQAKSVIKESRSNLKGLLDKYGDKKTLIQQSLLKTPQGQETFDFVKSEFGQEVAPIVESVTKRLYDPIPQDAKQGVSREDYKNAMISDLATIVDREYDPAKQDLDKFVGIRAFQRSNRLAKQLGIESVAERGGAGITTDVTEAKAITAEEKAPDEVSTKKPIAEALKLPKEISEKTNRLAELAAIKADKSLEGKETSDVKKLSARNKAFNDIFSKQLFNDIKTELGKNTKNSNDFSKYLDKNYEGLLDAALDNIDFQKGGGVSADWNTNPPTKQEFVDYYEATNEKASTRADRKKSLNNAIARQLANEARIEFAKKDPATAQLFKKKHGVVLASKPLPKGTPQELSEIPGYNESSGRPASKVWEALGLPDKEGYDISTEQGQVEFIKDFEELVSLGLPLDVFGSKSKIFPNYRLMTTAYRNSKKGVISKEDFNKIQESFREKIESSISKIKKSGNFVELSGAAKNWNAKGGFKKHIGETVVEIEKSNNSGKIAQYNAANMAMHRQVWKPLYEAVKSNKKFAKIATFLSQTAHGGAGWHRIGAEIVGYSKELTSKKGRAIEWEHAMQANNARLFLINSALNKVDFNLAYPAVVKNYKVIGLDKAADDKLKSANRSNSMGPNWNVYKSSWTERYFNPEVALFDGGINPSSIVDLNGSTFEEIYGVDTAGQPLTEIKSSKTLNKEFNDIIERVKGVASDATYSEARAIKLGKKNNPFKFFVPYSAEDYMGLVYPTLGKGAEGDKNLKWYKDNITDVYARGIRDFEIAKQQSMTQWTELKKQIKNSPAKLDKEAVRDFTNEEAIRLYLWDQQGMLPDNVAKKDIEAINKYIDSKPELKSFAEQIQGLTSDGYPAPTGDWLAGTITTDLVNYTNTASREQYLKQWQENVDVVYSKENMNKLRAIYGEDYTEALSDMLYRMKTGRNRPSGANKLTNQFMNWVNDSVGTIMFFNTRSALLQTISAVNYLNFTDNNPLRVAAAFANQKQYWSDFSEIFNSDFLKQRRGGLKTDVNADEIARAASTSDNKVRAALAAILKKGFLPTQLADSFAISVGGAAFYRNRINSLMKDGLTEEQAKEQAFLDFKETTEESQQSSRPDRVSMQQASPLGRVVLAFANTPMQYTRLTKKAALDLFNGRGDWKTNLSKLAYYGAVQNIIFTALQSAMFAMLFSDEEDDKEKEKIGRIGNGIADTLLRGSGVYGAGVAMIKNIVMEAIKQYNSGRPDYTKAAAKITSISPPVDSKIRKLQSVGRTFTYKQEIEKMRTKGFDIDNPAYMAVGQTVSALANIPLDRAVRKMNNLKTAVDQDTELWQSIGLALGYSEWDLGMIQAQQKKDKEQKKADKVKKAYMKKFGPKLDAKTKRIISFSKMSKDEKKEYIQKRAKAGQPLFKKDFSNSLPKGVLGRANKDGTIEVANGLSPTKKKQVIAHEKKHQEDMKSGKLNYDKNFIYWNNEKYKRTSNKKINYKGKLYIEGSPALPWEKAANNAEKQIN